MTAQILQFTARSSHKTSRPQAPHTCQVISFAEARAKRQRRLETQNVYYLNLDATGEPGQLGA